MGAAIRTGDIGHLRGDFQNTGGSKEAGAPPRELREAALEKALALRWELPADFHDSLMQRTYGTAAEITKRVQASGLKREGLAFDTPDGKPVHCMLLLGTSASRSTRHIEVLGALARAVTYTIDATTETLQTAERPRIHTFINASDVVKGDLDGGVLPNEAHLFFYQGVR